MSDKNLTEDEVLSNFITKMVDDKGEAGLTPEERGALETRLKHELDRYVEVSLIAALPDEKLLVLEKWLDLGMTDEEKDFFFEEAGINESHVIETALMNFRANYLGEVA